MTQKLPVGMWAWVSLLSQPRRGLTTTPGFRLFKNVAWNTIIPIFVHFWRLPTQWSSFRCTFLQVRRHIDLSHPWSWEITVELMSDCTVMKYFVCNTLANELPPGGNFVTLAPWSKDGISTSIPSAHQLRCRRCFYFKFFSKHKWGRECAARWRLKGAVLSANSKLA